MIKMKILIPIKTYSNTSFLKLIMENVLSELRKHIQVEEFWFVYTKGEKRVNELIIEALSDNILVENNMQKFVKNYIYKDDGLASERIAKIILNTIKN